MLGRTLSVCLVWMAIFAFEGRKPSGGSETDRGQEVVSEVVSDNVTEAAVVKEDEQPDLCDNNRRDSGEEAVDCGGECRQCKSCSNTKKDAECGEGGFCDSALNYLCSKRCRGDGDCQNSEAWDGEFCREDGRCSPKIFETVWEIKEGQELVLPFYRCKWGHKKPHYQVLWGDEAAGTDISQQPVNEKKHRYQRAGTYHVKIVGKLPCWGRDEAPLDAQDGDFIDDKLEEGQTIESLMFGNLKAVVSFGPAILGKGAFWGVGADFRLPARDIPNAHKLKTLDGCFMDSQFNQMVRWDTRNVRSMVSMFLSAKSFNQPVLFDTSRVKDMRYMFQWAESFNQVLDFETSHNPLMYFMLDGSGLSKKNYCEFWRNSTLRKNSWDNEDAKPECLK